MNIAVFGLPGSGKTLFARQLASRLNGVHISSDNIRSSLDRQGKYSDQAKLEVYQVMIRLMEDAIVNQQNVILDATFYKEDVRNLFIKKATQLDSTLFWIEIKAAEFVIKYRLSKKRRDSEAGFDAYLKVKSEFEPLTDEHLTLYSDLEELKEMLNKALVYINYPNGSTADQTTDGGQGF
jgi:predicted kinase